MADFVVRQWDLDHYPGDQAPPHVHHAADEGFAVIEGELDVIIDGQRHRLGPGDSRVVPAGAVHTFATVGSPVRLYAIMTPEVDELVAGLHAVSTPQEQADAWARARSSLVEPTRSDPS